MNETMKRVISGFMLAGIFIFSFNYDFYHGILLFFFVFIMGVFSLMEFYDLTTRAPQQRPHKKTGVVAGIITMILIYVHSLRESGATRSADDWFLRLADTIHLDFNVIAGLLLLLLMLLFIWQLARGEFEGTIYSVGTTFMGIIYVPLTFSHLFLLSILDYGNFYIWLVAWSTAMSDTMAYFSGITFGKTKVGLAASPNKTYEGYIGGLVGQLVMTHLFYLIAQNFFSVPEMSFMELTLFGVVIYVASVIGDLSESALKRDMGVKDSGNKIPGHGGFLDLADALMLTLPGAYYFIVIMKLLQ